MTQKPSRPDGRNHDDGDDDAATFAEAMRGVVRHQPQRIAAPAPPPDARPRLREADEAEALRESLTHTPEDVLIAAGDILEYRASGVPESVFRRLKRGQYRIGSELDLHGMNLREAKQAVRAFLLACREADLRCVRIVHGKGLRSGREGPVLKRSLDGWLRHRSDVLAFTSARPAQGGAGAAIVLLRQPAR